MRILIFENEIQAHKSTFDDVNFLDFDNQLEIDWSEKYKKLSSKEYHIYDLIFIDIDLSIKSEKDGYAIISELKQVHNYHNIVVITAHDVKDKLKSNGWGDIKILEKPLFFEDLENSISHYKK